MGPAMLKSGVSPRRTFVPSMGFGEMGLVSEGRQESGDLQEPAPFAVTPGPKQGSARTGQRPVAPDMGLEFLGFS